MTAPLRSMPTVRHRLRTLTLKLVTGSPVEPWLRRAYGRLGRTQGAQYDRETAAVMQRVLTPASVLEENIALYQVYRTMFGMYQAAIAGSDSRRSNGRACRTCRITTAPSATVCRRIASAC